MNATILLAAMIGLTLTPATVSSPVTRDEWVILGVGLVLLVIANAVLLRISFSGLTGLVRRMETLDLLWPNERLPEIGGAETRALISGFNAMLDRLETERRASPAGRSRGSRPSASASGRSSTTRSGSG